MKPRARTAPAQMSRLYNHTAAFAKVQMAPLATLTGAMLKSIAASHARRGTAAFDQLLRDLREVVEMRRGRE